MRAKALLGIIAMSGLLAIPSTGFAQHERNFERENHWYNNWYDRWNGNDRNASDLQGRWYMEGDRDRPTEIDRNNGRLEATNENGQTSRLEIDRNGNVIADGWHDLRGEVTGNRIEWNNGTTWTRRPSERIGRRYDRWNDNSYGYNRWDGYNRWNGYGRQASDLQGRWYMEGDRDQPTYIDTQNGRLQATNENGQTTRLEVDRYGNVIADNWHDLHGDVRGNRIEWDNGTTWTRSPTENIGLR